MREKIQKISKPIKSFFSKKIDFKKIFVKNFIAGVAWGIGATLGLSLILTLLTTILRRLGGLPIVGSFFADLIDVTFKALEMRRIR